MATPSESNGLELRVGFFVLLGLAVIGSMVVIFGRVGTGIAAAYPLTVEFPNAGGLLVNSKVLLSGATVGVVTDAPQVLPHARGVSVRIKVFEPNRIPRNAKFYVAAAGLLGDRFVDVITEPEDVGGYFRDGDTVRGSTKPGTDELTDQAGKLIADLRGAVANLNGTITRINTEMLRPEMFKNLQDSVANLNVTTGNFKAASEKLGGVLDDAHGVVMQAHAAMDGAKDTLASAKGAADDVRGAIGDTRKVLGTVRSAADQAVHGPGLLGTLISNKELSDNMAALVSNLRRSGVLFYKDRPAPSAEPGPTPAEAATRPPNRRH